jgi:hypothetical protein
MFAGNEAGEVLPPYVVYETRNFGILGSKEGPKVVDSTDPSLAGLRLLPFMIGSHSVCCSS